MAYQVLARKWRPRSFDTLVGQDHVVRALTHALDHGRLHHAYLFTGTRGVGKTTLARILAKALNCETGVTSRPCGTCSACREIDAGRFVDLLEIDAATNTGVDDVRALQDNAAYAPTRGRFKVFVIDEVHMLSKPAFNAMLKTLEEPPEHIKFILATTDPQKIPVTVLSRCLQFNLKNMPQPAIVGHLDALLRAEEVVFELGALRHLARAAQGSMRDALSLLDQAIAHGAGTVQEAAVRDMLGTVGEEYLFQLLDAVLAADAPSALDVVREMEGRSLSFQSALQEMATILHGVAVAQFAPGASGDTEPGSAKIAQLAGRFDAEYLQLCYQIAVQARDQLHLAPDEAAGFSMALMRMVAFSPEHVDSPAAAGVRGKGSARQVAPPVRRQAAADRVAQPLGATGLLPAGRAAVSEAPLSAPLSSVQPVASDLPVSRLSEPVAEPRTTAREPRQALSGVAEPVESDVKALPVGDAPGPAPAASVAQEVVAMDDWHRLIQSMNLRGMPRELANHCDLVTMADDAVVLRISPQHRALLLGTNPAKLEAELAGRLGRGLRVTIEVGEVVGQTLAQRLKGEERERRDRAIESIENDAFVREAIDMFDAELNEQSIRPL